MKPAGLKAGVGLALTLAFGHALADKTPKEMDPIKVLEQANNIVLLAFDTLRHHESGNQHFGGEQSVAGKNEPTTSNKGAIGLIQALLPSAREAVERTGYVFNESLFRNDATYNYATGFLYFNNEALVGNVLKHHCAELSREAIAMTYAAYHSGTGNLSNAVKAYGADWLTAEDPEGTAKKDRKALGPNGKEYVAKNMKDFDGVLKNINPNHSLAHAKPCHFM